MTSYHTIISLSIAEKRNINIYMPKATLKQNMFYEPSDEINMFDEVIVAFESSTQCRILTIDFVGFVVASLREVLVNLIAETLPLPTWIERGCLGKFLNRRSYFLEDPQIRASMPNIYPRFRIWSYVDGPQTFAYNYKGKVWFEIVPEYPWLYRDPWPDEPCFSFEEFMNSYKAVALFSITKETAQRWYNEVEKVRLLYEDEFGNPLD